MSQNQNTERHVTAESGTPTADRNETANRQWEQLVSELLACSDGRKEGFDEMAIARYLSGTCSEEERREVERMIGQSSDLADCIALAPEVLRGKVAAA